MAFPTPKRITELDLSSPLTDADQIAIVQNTRTKRATISQIKDVLDDGCECSPVSRFTQVGNAANTLEQYLHTWQMPDDFLPTSGSWAEIDITGQFEANTDTKIVSLRFGSDYIVNSATYAGADANSKFWHLKAKVTRATQNSQTMTAHITSMPRAGSPDTPKALGLKASGSQDLSSSINVQLSVQSSTATANNILVDDFHVVVHYLDANS